MKTQGIFEIEFGGLDFGTHEFDFEITDEFFSHFEYSKIKNGALQVQVLLDKEEGFMSLTLQISGTVNLACDRCLNRIDYPIETTQVLIVNQGEESGETDADVDSIILADGETRMDVAQHVYEYINLALPLTVNCDGLENVVCDEATLRKLKAVEQTGNIETTDPRWDKLKDLDKTK